MFVMGKKVSARIKNKIKSLFARSINKLEKTVGKYDDTRMSDRHKPKR